MSTSKTSNNPLEIEKQRETHAIDGNKTGFMNLYAKSIPKILNQNSQSLWENMLPKEMTNISPMTSDRINQTSRIALDYINKQNNKSLSIFDLGIGNGHVEKIIIKKCKRNLNIHGVDIAHSNLDKLYKSLPNFTGLKLDICDFPSKRFNEKFDIVFVLEVMEHINAEMTFNVLSKISSILKDESRLILSVPINENLGKKLKKE